MLNEICPSLKLCIVTSEMLFEEDKILLEKQLGIPVVNEYGASELGLLAFENPDKKWIISSGTIFLEIVDPQGKPLQNGQEGRILLTSLYNKAHPFIGYEIGDSGILSPESNTKTPILQKLSGRTSDVAILPSGKIVHRLVFYYVTKSVIEDEGVVKEFIVQQLQLHQFQILYASEVKRNTQKTDQIKKAMEKYLEEGLQVLFQHENTLNRTKNGKLKQFESFL